jgi:hypothetical protein
MSRSVDRVLALIDAALGVPMRSGFVIHHNGPPANCLGRPHSRCISFWNAVRSYHMDGKGWSDIAYSFGVCPHGTRFTGRGWDRAQFANGSDVVGADDGGDSHWFTVLVFLGWSEVDGQPADEEPTPEMIEGVRNLIAEGRTSKRCDRRVLPHNAFKIKRCPGATFTALAAEWDNAPLVDAPAPTPPPIEDVDDMFTYEFTKDGVKHLRVVEGNHQTALTGQAIHHQREGKANHLVVGLDEVERFDKHYGPAT